MCSVPPAASGWWACAEIGPQGHSATHPEPTSALFPVPVLQTCLLSGASSSHVPRSLLHTGRQASPRGLHCLSLHPVAVCGRVIHLNLANRPKDASLAWLSPSEGWCRKSREGHIPGSAQGNGSLNCTLNVSSWTWRIGLLCFSFSQICQSLEMLWKWFSVP